MACEHTFLGTWEIVCCTYEGKCEISGLEGIKFRLDDTSDITWYNDLVSPLPESKDCGTCCDSASVLFSCETFEVNETNPRLIFGAIAGHSIEFSTSTLTPTDTLVLNCENWYAVECKRLKDSQAAGQEKEFSFVEALQETYFSDVVIKSSSGLEYQVHSSILRLNGFDCSMCVLPMAVASAQTQLLYQTCRTPENVPPSPIMRAKHCHSSPNTPNPIKISVSTDNTIGIPPAPGSATLIGGRQCQHDDAAQKLLPRLNLSPIYLQPPNEYASFGLQPSHACLSMHRTAQLSSSFNCLSTTTQQQNSRGVGGGGGGGVDAIGNASHLTVDGGGGVSGMRRFPPTSHSDSHLEATQTPHCKNIFNFCPDLMLQPTTEHTLNTGMVCSTRRPPLSPYRARSPSPFPSSMDTPPSSPLTPVGVLYNLPTFLLNPILHWLYTESLLPELDEDVCERLIHFAETQPSLTKMVEPTRKYLKLIRLKKFVVNVIMDLHAILNRVIQSISPVTISHEPVRLYATFKDSLRECAIGSAKVLQFCNIFIKDAADITRYQKNEIVKYVRTRIPIFLSQIQQLMRNTLNVFVCLTPDEKSELVNYLVPEIESTLLILTDVIEEIKNSLENMCKDLKCSHLDLSLKQEKDEALAMQIQNNTLQIAATKTLDGSETNRDTAALFAQPPLSPRPRRGPPAGLTLYDNSTDKQRFMTAENDLKFVFYMYEVRKMRDIYGRISAALDIIKDKKSTFCEMDFLSKRSTINQNLEQLIMDIPAYIFIIENINDRLDEKLGWKEFKFCFKLATSQINGVIVKILDHKAALRDAISQICKLVSKQEFTQSLIELGLLEPSNTMQSELKLSDHEGNMTASDALHLDRRQVHDYKNIKLNLIWHLCESPIAANSNLSKNALRLLHSAQLADMEFEVHTFAPANVASMAANQALVLQMHTFKAHRVIVSARCEWFKKALMSGMQESINRKVIITDTTPVIFRRLLLYLYGAPIDKTVGAEQICELMLLADRYSIEDLKELCENTLNSLIDEDSVLCLLGIADRYMATALKSNCLSFLTQHSTLTKGEMFRELPQTLQLEVMDLIHWYGRVSEPWNERGFKPRSSSHHSLKSPSKPRSRSRKSSPSYM